MRSEEGRFGDGSFRGTRGCLSVDGNATGGEAYRRCFCLEACKIVLWIDSLICMKPECIITRNDGSMVPLDFDR